MTQSTVTAMSAPTRTIQDCWNRIGVRGDRSCPELKRHVHCRNCPVYSAAATRLLDGELSADYIAAWTAHFAEEKAVDELGTDSIVIFRIGSEWLALPTRVFVEVADVRAVHSLPHRRSAVILGLTNVRGELLICVSLGTALGLETVAEKPDQRRTVHKRLLVIQSEACRLVFPVDEVCGVQRFHASELGEVPATVAGAAATYTKAILPWKGKSVGCLDEQLLFYTLNRSLA